MKDSSKEKILIDKYIFHEINYKRPLKWSDIKHLELQDDDVISSGHEEAYYGSDSAMESHFFMSVTRQVLETDDEYTERQRAVEQSAKWAKANRLESYKRLREEFKDLNDEI